MGGMKIDVLTRTGARILPDGLILPDDVRLFYFLLHILSIRKSGILIFLIAGCSLVHACFSNDLQQFPPPLSPGFSGHRRRPQTGIFRAQASLLRFKATMDP
jgi:hypothetical protein